jgi:thiamine transport system substrate-binding protein
VVSFFRQNKFILFLSVCLLGLFGLSRLIEPKSEETGLTIYSYSSFSASWGAGPLIKKMFEEHCRCKVNLRDADDSRLLIHRLKLEGVREGADVVIGLNHWDVDEAVDNLNFKPFNWDRALLRDDELLPNELDKRGLVPFDWGLLTFNTRKNSVLASARNLDQILNLASNKSIALQDPRTSAPGLTFLFWLVQTLGEDQAFAFLDQFRSKIFSFSPGWSSSYGLFQKGDAKGVFSYISSPLYHEIEEKDFNYVALPLEEGLPVHIEYAGVLSTCRQCERAREFINFILTPRIQEILMSKNYMLPVNKAVEPKGSWNILGNYKITSPKKFSPSEKQRILERWSRWVRGQ